MRRFCVQEIPTQRTSNVRKFRPIAIVAFFLFSVSLTNAQSILTKSDSNGRNLTRFENNVAKAVIDSLQTALDLTPYDCFPVTKTGSKQQTRASRSAIIASLTEMRDELGLNFDIPWNLSKRQFISIMDNILEAAKNTPPSVQTRIATEIEQLVATLHGMVEKDGRRPLEAWGFKMGTDSSLADSIFVPFGDYQGFLDTSASDTGAFFLEQTGLTRYTTYYYSAWAKNDKGMGFGDTLSFVTLPDLPSGLSLSTDSISQNSALLRLTIADAGGQGPDSVGFAFGTLDFENFAQADDSIASESFNGTAHSVMLTGLSRYTTYFFNAYADNLAGRAVTPSNEQFVTLPTAPVLDSILLLSNPPALSCKLLDLGGDLSHPAPDSTGFYLGSSEDLSGATVLLTSFSNADSSFSVSIDALSPGEHYHCAAFAANTGGFSVSDTLEFVTPPTAITNAEISNLTDTSFTLSGQFVYNTIAPVAVGMLWGTQADLSDAVDVSAVLLPDTTIHVTLENQPTGFIYYSTYAVTNAGTRIQGDTLAFNVPIPLHDGNIHAAVNAWIDDPVDAAQLYGHISDWYTGAVTNMQSLFIYKANFNDDIGNWNMSNVQNTSYMFNVAESFNQDLSNWDMSNVTNAAYMFNGAKAFQSDLSTWSIGKVTNFERMFALCYDFNSELDDWDVGSVTNMKGMFAFSSFNADLNNWDVSNCTDFSNMFTSAGDFNGDLSSWDVSAVTTMRYMFHGTPNFQGDLSSWIVSSVNDMEGMFQYSAFDSDLPLWDVSAVTNMKSMFASSSFNGDIKNWNVASVTSMSNMFNSDTLINADLSGWIVSSVNDMSSMFSGAQNFASDISGWNVGAVTDMSGMFKGTLSFQYDLGTWDVSQVTSMKEMFQWSFYDGDLSGWNVGQVEDMSKMFNGAKFNRPLNAWDVSSVENMSTMFNQNHEFNQDISTWDVSSVTDLTWFIGIASSFSDSHYDAILSSWKDLDLQQDVQFTNTSKYTCNVGAKSYIESAFNWTITDNGLPFEPCPATLPTVVTQVADSIGANSFNLKAVIAHDGGESIGNYGFVMGFQADLSDGGVWSHIPTDLDEAGNLSQFFDSPSFGPGDVFYYVAFAENNQGTAYGDTLSVTTLTFAPIVESLEWNHIELGTTQLNGKIESNGGHPISSRGFKWGTNASLANAADTALSAVASDGSFECILNNLTDGDTIYYAAYAGNELGVSFGDTVFFVPDVPFVCGVSTVTYNGVEYQTVGYTIPSTGATQCWFKENLKTDALRDGTPIPEVTDGTAWTEQTTAARCSYNNDPVLGASYGFLYNWYTVDTEKLCPSFWDVPYGPSAYFTLGTETAAIKATQSDTPGWDGNNTTGWSAVPAGIRGPSSVGYDYFGAFKHLNERAYFWIRPLNTLTDQPQATRMTAEGQVPATNMNAYTGQYRDYGLSVRCVKIIE